MLVYFYLLLSILGMCLAKTHQSAFKIVDYDQKTGTFTANPAGLRHLESLTSPLYVVSALGDARIGKSTTFNQVIQNWSCGPPQPHGEQFKTGKLDGHYDTSSDDVILL